MLPGPANSTDEGTEALKKVTCSSVARTQTMTLLSWLLVYSTGPGLGGRGHSTAEMFVEAGRCSLSLSLR